MLVEVALVEVEGVVVAVLVDASATVPSRVAHKDGTVPALDLPPNAAVGHGRSFTSGRLQDVKRHANRLGGRTEVRSDVVV